MILLCVVVTAPKNNNDLLWLERIDELATRATTKPQTHHTTNNDTDDYWLVGVPHPYKGPAELNSTLYIWRQPLLGMDDNDNYQNMAPTHPSCKPPLVIQLVRHHLCPTLPPREGTPPHLGKTTTTTTAMFITAAMTLTNRRICSRVWNRLYHHCQYNDWWYYYRKTTSTTTRSRLERRLSPIGRATLFETTATNTSSPVLILQQHKYDPSSDH
jgi:hypothetical protein